MLITVTKISRPDHDSIRTLVREEHHQVAVDPELDEVTPPTNVLSSGVSLITTPVDPARKADLEKICKIAESSIWPIAKETMPFTNSTVEGVEIVFAGKKLWNRLAAEDEADRMQIALAATDFGLELYDLLKKFVPPLQAVEPYRGIAGLLVNSADSAYAVYVSKDEA